jgi:hypothetical protein
MSVLNMDKDKESIFMAVSYLTCVIYVHFHVLGRMMFLDFVLLLMFLKKRNVLETGSVSVLR